MYTFYERGGRRRLFEEEDGTDRVGMERPR
jgi:hypothetical protein